MKFILRGTTYNACLVYLDDVIVTGHTFQEQLNNLQKVFQRLREACLKMNPKKCLLLRKEIQYLGHIVLTSGVTMEPKKQEAVKNWPRLTDKHQLRSFLGLCTYHRRFTAGFPDIAKPLTRMTEEKWTFEWSPEAQTAFQSLKEAMCTARVLGYPRPGGRSLLTPTPAKWGLVEYCPKYKMEVYWLWSTSAKLCPRPRGTTV